MLILILFYIIYCKGPVYLIHLTLFQLTDRKIFLVTHSQRSTSYIQKLVFRKDIFTMKPDQLILSNLGIDRAYVYKFPPELPMSHDLGLSLFSHAGTVVGTSLRHHRKFCSSGNVMVHGAFNRLNRLSRAIFFWLSRPSDPKIFHWLSAIAASGSRSCQLSMKQVSSHMQNLTRLQFGFLVREEQAIQILLARLANASIGLLRNDFEKQGTCNLLTLAGAAAIVPALENM